MSTSPNIIVTTASNRLFEAEDATDDRFWISGKLIGGELTFAVIARLSTGERGTVSGTEYFDAMIAHFGAAISIIDGEWSDLDPMFAAIIEEFNRLTATGIIEEDAAAQVWTGRMACRYSFTQVEIVHARPKAARGKYRDVLARFRKPASP